jgi:CheY-like chemotaxis protein
VWARDGLAARIGTCGDQSPGLSRDDSWKAGPVQEETMEDPCHGRLLLVEDEDLLRSLVAQFLRNEGYRIVEAADGGAGVERFMDSGPFDLVLLDLNLPVFSGVEVCRRIKLACPQQRVMVCSAAILRDHENALEAMGVEHFLTKPYHPDELITHIAREIGPPQFRRVKSLHGAPIA